MAQIPTPNWPMSVLSIGIVQALRRCSLMSDIIWPDAHRPAGAAVHETNVASAEAAPEAVWAWLVRPDRWEQYYGNVSKVKHISGPWPEIALGSTFSWTTFHTKVTTEVTEFEPFQRLAWTGHGLGATGHHAWLLTASNGGTNIRTEETQRGALIKLLAPRIRRDMRSWHQKWVDGLAATAASGRRP